MSAQEQFINKLADVIGIQPGDVDAQTPLVDYGVDSLAAVELTSYLKDELKIETSQMEILGGATIADLVAKRSADAPLPSSSAPALAPTSTGPIAPPTVVAQSAPEEKPRKSHHKHHKREKKHHRHSHKKASKSVPNPAPIPTSQPPAPAPAPVVPTPAPQAAPSGDLEAQFISKLADVIGIQPSDVDPQTPLVDYGVDSLAAVELTSYLKDGLGIETSQMEILGGATVSTLLEKAGSGPAPAPVQATAPAPAIPVASVPAPAPSPAPVEEPAKTRRSHKKEKRHRHHKRDRHRRRHRSRSRSPSLGPVAPPPARLPVVEAPKPVPVPVPVPVVPAPAPAPVPKPQPAMPAPAPRPATTTTPAAPAAPARASHSEVIVELRDGAVEVRLDRAERENTLSNGTVSALLDILADPQNKDRALIITSASAQYFCTGFDLAGAGQEGFSGLAFSEGILRYTELIRAMDAHPMPVVSVVRGAVRGGGMLFPCVSDVVLASQDATFGFPEIRRGTLPAVVSTVAERRMSASLLRSLVLTGDPIDARRAVFSGLVDQLAEDDAQLRSLLQRLEGRFRVAGADRLALARKRIPAPSVESALTLLGEMHFPFIKPELPGPPVVRYLRGSGPDQGIGIIELCNGERFNMMSLAQVIDFGKAVEQAKADPDLRCLIIRGTGPHFCAGLDPFLFSNFVGESKNLVDLAARCYQVFLTFAQVRDLPVPVLAALHGTILGGGLAIAVSADWRATTPGMRISTGILPRGLCFGFQLTESLARAVGHTTALKMYLEDKEVTAKRARAIGLVQKIVDDDSVEHLHMRVLEMARDIVRAPSVGVEHNVPMMKERLSREALALEAFHFAQTLQKASTKNFSPAPIPDGPSPEPSFFVSEPPSTNISPMMPFQQVVSDVSPLNISFQHISGGSPLALSFQPIQPPQHGTTSLQRSSVHASQLSDDGYETMPKRLGAQQPPPRAQRHMGGPAFELTRTAHTPFPKPPRQPVPTCPAMMATRVMPFVTRFNEAENQGVTPFHVSVTSTERTNDCVVEVRSGSAGLGSGPVGGRDREMTMMTSGGNYHNLCNDPRVVEAAVESARRFGSGTLGSRVLTGTTEEHVMMEQELANFMGCEDAMSFASGYAANIAVIPTLVGPGDYVFTDSLNHASIIDAAKLSGAMVVQWTHGNLDHLERRLRGLAAEDSKRERPVGKLVICDGAFSSTGELCDLPELHRICVQYGVSLVIDEAHSLGVCGPHGRGVEEYFNMMGSCTLKVGTLGKALGSVGGYAAGSKELIKYLKYQSRGYLYSSGISSAQCAAVRASLRILSSPEGEVICRRVKSNKALWQRLLEERGFRLRPTHPDSAIVSLFSGDDEIAMKLGTLWMQNGAIGPPMLGEGKETFVRCTISSAHTPAELERVANGLAIAAFKAGLLQQEPTMLPDYTNLPKRA